MVVQMEDNHFRAFGGLLRLQIMISIFVIGLELVSSEGCKEQPSEAQWKFITMLKKTDKCKAKYISSSNGYQIKEFKVRTKDDYVLTMHRLIHPEDIASGGPKRGTKKPYLLLHGLVGSSSSFLRNIDWRYKAPEKSFDSFRAIDFAITTTNYDTDVRCTAKKFQMAFEGDKTASLDKLSFKNRLLKIVPEREFCHIQELDFDGDPLVWGQEFKQAYRKYELNSDARRQVSTSLAFTLSNFGYDVWLLNLRGNEYSREHTRLKASENKFWEFNIETLVQHDLPAQIEEVRELTGVQEPLGLVAYSYSALHVLRLLTKYPRYQESLQPVVLMAPALLVSKDSHLTMKYFMKIMRKTVMRSEGPFPSFGHASKDGIERLLCKLPVASRLCHLLETVLHGKTENISEVSKILMDDKRTSLMKEDIDCGQTSLAVLKQIIDNLEDTRIHHNYIPWQAARNLILGKKMKTPRRSVMLIHSKDDDISNLDEVKQLRQAALRTMALVEHLITYPKFEHADFLFSHANQFLVNAEIARMTSLFDYMMYAKAANRQKQYTPLNTKPLGA